MKLNSIVWGSLFLIQINAFGFGSHRYPIDIEYELMQRCVTGDARTRSTQSQEELVRLCACKIEEAQDNVKYKVFQKDPQKFIEAFKKASNECKTKPENSDD